MVEELFLQMTSEVSTHALSHYARTFIPTQFTKYYLDVPATLNRAAVLIREISSPNLDRETKYPD